MTGPTTRPSPLGLRPAGVLRHFPHVAPHDKRVRGIAVQARHPIQCKFQLFRPVALEVEHRSQMSWVAISGARSLALLATSAAIQSLCRVCPNPDKT